jgi:hypothetical protein
MEIDTMALGESTISAADSITSRNVRDLEMELEEKNRYIKRLEAQMLVSPLAEQSVPAVEKAALDKEMAKIQEEKDVVEKAPKESADAKELAAEATLGAASNPEGFVELHRSSTSSTAEIESRKFEESSMMSTAALLTTNSAFPPHDLTLQEDESTLQRMLQMAELELERKDAELHACREAASSTSPLGQLQQEYGKLTKEIRQLFEQKQACAEECRHLQNRLCEREAQIAELERRLSRQTVSEQHVLRRIESDSQNQPSSPGMSASWRHKASALEEELKQKAETVARLRQRELWFEAQLHRQAEANVMPLEAILNELRVLQEGTERLPAHKLKLLSNDTASKFWSETRSAKQLPEAPAVVLPLEKAGQVPPSTAPRSGQPIAGGPTFFQHYC